MTAEASETRAQTVAGVSCETAVAGLTCLRVSRAERAHAGNYELLIENPLGREQLSLQVRVPDAPSMPRNLRVADLQGERCRLVWEASADDGDAPPVEYVVEERDASVRRGVSLLLGETPATESNVEALALGKSYVFQVSARNSVGRSEPVETATVVAQYTFGVHTAVSLSLILIQSLPTHTHIHIALNREHIRGDECALQRFRGRQAVPK